MSHTRACARCGRSILLGEGSYDGDNGLVCAFCNNAEHRIWSVDVAAPTPKEAPSWLE